MELNDFIGYHQIVSTQFESEREFKNLMTGVWSINKMNFDKIPVVPSTPIEKMRQTKGSFQLNYYPDNVVGNRMVQTPKQQYNIISN